MQIIKPSFEIIEQEPGKLGMFRQVEKCARLAYKSEDKITDTSYRRFCNMLESRGHWACFEQGTVYMKIPFIIDGEYSGQWVQSRYEENPYSKVYCDGSDYYITTNQRVIMENGWEDDAEEFRCNCTEFHNKRICVKITTSRGISHELVRHRVFSFIQSSQRYCNYSLGKFNHELTFILPEWIYNVRNDVTHREDGELLLTRKYLYELDGLRLVRELACEDRSVACWLNSLTRAEEDYMFLTTTNESYKLTPQEARGILPNDCMTEICMTGFIDQWKEFFKLRCASDAHPDMQVLANMIENEFIKRNYLNE